METISATSGFWSVFLLLLILAIQVGAAAGFVWLVVFLTTRKTTAETNARLQDLEQRMGRLEGSTPSDSPAE